MPANAWLELSLNEKTATAFSMNNGASPKITIRIAPAQNFFSIETTTPEFKPNLFTAIDTTPYSKLCALQGKIF